jgi:hypothetical protein
MRRKIVVLWAAAQLGVAFGQVFEWRQSSRRLLSDSK